MPFTKPPSVNDGETVFAIHVNSLGDASAAAFAEVDVNIAALGSLTTAWVTTPSGSEVDAINYPGIYSISAYATESKDWATADAGHLDTDPWPWNDEIHEASNSPGTVTSAPSIKSSAYFVNLKAGEAEADAAATAADRIQTGLDVVATGADRIQTGLDVIATGADLVETAQDVIDSGANATTASSAAADALAYRDEINLNLLGQIHHDYGLKAVNFSVDASIADTFECTLDNTNRTISFINWPLGVSKTILLRITSNADNARFSGVVWSESVAHGDTADYTGSGNTLFVFSYINGTVYGAMVGRNYA